MTWKIQVCGISTQHLYTCGRKIESFTKITHHIKHSSVWNNRLYILLACTTTMVTLTVQLTVIFMLHLKIQVSTCAGHWISPNLGLAYKHLGSNTWRIVYTILSDEPSWTTLSFLIFETPYFSQDVHVYM